MKKFFKGYISAEQELIQKMGVVRSTLTKSQVMQQLGIDEVQLAAKILDGSVHRLFIDGNPFFQITN